MTVSDLEQIREIVAQEIRKALSPVSAYGYDLDKIAELPLAERQAFWKAEMKKNRGSVTRKAA